VILVDTGPLVALFDPRDANHLRCRDVLAKHHGPLLTTVPVLVEAIYLLDRVSPGAALLRRFARSGGLTFWWFDERRLARALELMDDYHDQPMDLADASLVAAAESERLRRVFTLDVRDFSVYRIRQGHQHFPFQIVP
jgi:uncharacterized protein